MERTKNLPECSNGSENLPSQPQKSFFVHSQWLSKQTFAWIGEIWQKPRCERIPPTSLRETAVLKVAAAFALHAKRRFRRTIIQSLSQPTHPFRLMHKTKHKNYRKNFSYRRCVDVETTNTDESCVCARYRKMRYDSHAARVQRGGGDFQADYRKGTPDDSVGRFYSKMLGTTLINRFFGSKLISEGILSNFRPQAESRRFPANYQVDFRHICDRIG